MNNHCLDCNDAHCRKPEQNQKARIGEIQMLRSDIHRAIGFIQELGYHDEYLEKKYKVK